MALFASANEGVVLVAGLLLAVVRHVGPWLVALLLPPIVAISAPIAAIGAVDDVHGRTRPGKAERQ